MRVGVRVLVLVLLFPLLLILVPPTSAQCGVQSEVGEVVETCDYSSGDIEAEKAKFPTAQWSVRQICKDDRRNPEGLCFNPDECTTAAGLPGTRYTLFKDGEYEGTACLSAGEAETVDDPPPVRVLVIRMFEQLDWPQSELTVQPPGGKTLVNFETNFYTSNNEPTDISVTLVQSNVVVTARPIAYQWNFGDGTSITTDSPGRPYPDLDVSHTYDRADPVVVSIDTQYGDASFTVNGGPPETIPSTVWVTGATEDLEVVEALPQLVIR